MIKTARQLKDLIRNLSKNKSADAQILLRNYMMERFLERISLSEYREKFVLKGGMLVAAMVGLDARSTMDIDATIKGATVGIEEVENMIASIVSVPLDDGVSSGSSAFLRSWMRPNIPTFASAWKRSLMAW